MITVLLDRGAGLEEEDEEGRTALFYTLGIGVNTYVTFLPPLQLLLARGANPTHRNHEGEDPLAVASGHYRRLKRYGAVLEDEFEFQRCQIAMHLLRHALAQRRQRRGAVGQP